MIIKVVVPKWALPLKKRFREVKFAYEELEVSIVLTVQILLWTDDDDLYRRDTCMK